MRFVLACACLLLACPAYAGIVIMQQTFAPPQVLWQVFSSTPKSNESLSKPPQAIVLTFSQAVNPATASIKLYDPYNNPVATGETSVNGAVMSVSVPALKPGYAGIYRVEWSANCQCSETRTLTGSYNFNIQ